ncbi:MAG TPA: PIN domain-containing protein [Solirubrobacterales bacterium]|nr:PIN domain-containing protein [Solirubrobacterales bacterium]
MKLILDTSVLIARQPLPPDVDAAISTLSLTELYFGILTASDPDTRAYRAAHLGRVEAAFDALPLDERVARALGQLQAAVTNRGGKHRRRTADLAIAATAVVHEATLLTKNYKDLKIVDDLVDVQEPSA